MKDELVYKPFGFLTYKKVYILIDIILYKDKKEYLLGYSQAILSIYL